MQPLASDNNNLKDDMLFALTLLALIFFLIYNFFHTAAAMARYVNPPFIGYVAALGVEIAIVVLSIRIGDLRTQKKSAFMQFGILIGALSVSTLANLTEGFQVAYNQNFTINAFYALDQAQIVISIAMTALISFLVFMLTETISADVEKAFNNRFIVFVFQRFVPAQAVESTALVPSTIIDVQPAAQPAYTPPTTQFAPALQRPPAQTAIATPLQTQRQRILSSTSSHGIRLSMMSYCKRNGITVDSNRLTGDLSTVKAYALSLLDAVTA